MLVRAFQRMLVSYQVQLVSYTVPGSNVRGSLNRGHYEMFLFNGEGVFVRQKEPPVELLTAD